jgi:hypothetical protein
MMKKVILSILWLMFAAALTNAEENKSAPMASIEKKINDEFSAYTNDIKNRQKEVLEKLNNYKSILQNVNSGKWTLDERNLGCSIIDSKIQTINTGMDALLATEEVEPSADPSNPSITENPDQTTSPLKATKANTLPKGIYTIKAYAWNTAEIYINGELFPAGEEPSSFEYEVNGPIQITVKCKSIAGKDRHGFGFIMQNSNGKEVITTKSGWKSYRPNSLTDWHMDKEIQQLGKIYETAMPSPLGKAALIWDSRDEGAAMCYLVWGR